MLVHDLRNPLNALAVSAEVLKRVGSTVPEVQGTAAVIGRQVAKLAALIDTRLAVQRHPPTAVASGPWPAKAAPWRLAVIDAGESATGLQAALQAAGHAVYLTDRADDGLAMLWRDAPDLAWVSIDLPGPGGCGFARQARAGGYTGRLVATADHRLAADPADSLAAGFEAHLLRPVPPTLLARLLLP